jgi:demethylmenaquinone methyltransferase/2-methoxy-6-polyprenyl-1,4-benzoquinol methylase
MSHDLDPSFLAGQQDYYRARAPEYNEWWERRGRYDHGPEANARWFNEQAEVYAALDQLQLTGQVLELACGTGNWTEALVRTAEHVTAVDGSAEMLAINRERLRSDRVEYVQADLFAWQPDRRYDAVVTGFWLSHVPPEQLDAFLAMVRRALVPGGRYFFVDSRRDPLTTTPDQPLPEEEQAWLTRRLNDGREFRIVKVFYDPAVLRQRLEAQGLEAEVRETESFFLYGWARARE